MRRTALIAARKASGYTQESLAAALNVDRSTVIRWEAGDYAPQPYLRPKLARILQQTPTQLRELIDGAAPVEAIELSPSISSACAWLDQQLGWAIGTSQQRVTALMSTPQPIEARRARRAVVNRSDIARALKAYYGDGHAPYTTYTASLGGRTLETSILTHPEWLDLRTALSPDNDRLRLRVDAIGEPATKIDPEAAIQRLAEAHHLGVRLTNEPLYQLLRADVRQGALEGEVDTVPFLQYALTMDLLEGELLDALADGRPVRRGSLPLRDKYLPTVDAALDFPSRLCAGGILALCAIARGPEPHGGTDHLLLVQQRSGAVLNAMRQLAVIPKGFHQPLSDFQADTAIRRTLLRELEEELFGRGDLDNTLDGQRAAAPMHPQRMSDPMKWLVAEPGRLQLEFSGFGINLVSGNYEFACLLVIEDPEFWRLYGGQVEANWEAKGLRTYASAERDALVALGAVESWSNEGLFAFVQGLQRLMPGDQ